MVGPMSGSKVSSVNLINKLSNKKLQLSKAGRKQGLLLWLFKVRKMLILEIISLSSKTFHNGLVPLRKDS